MLLLLLAACTPDADPSSGRDPRGDDSGGGVDSGEAGEPELCSDGVDNDLDGAVDGADTECRGRVVSAEQLVASDVLSVTDIGAAGDELRVLAGISGKLTFAGAPVATSYDSGQSYLGLDASGVVEVPTVLDGRGDVVLAPELREHGLTAVVRADLLQPLVDSEGATLDPDRYSTLRQTSSSDARLLGLRIFAGAQYTAVGATNAGAACVAGYLEDQIAETSGAFTPSEDAAAAFLSWIAADGSGEVWSLALASIPGYGRNVAAVPVGDRCLVAVPWSGGPSGALSPWMQEMEEGLLVISVGEAQDIEVLATVSGYVPSVVQWGRTAEGGAWLHMEGSGCTIGSSAPFGSAALAWGPDLSPEPVVAFTDLGALRGLARLGPSDYLATATGEVQVVEGGSGTVGRADSLTFSRITDGEEVWQSIVSDPNGRLDYISFGATLADDDTVLVASAQGPDDVTLGVGTPEQTILAANKRQNSRLAVFRFSP